MTPEELENFYALTAIINLTQDMFKELDEYRARKNKDDKSHLFAARTIENKIRKSISEEADKYPSTQNKTKAA